jgi:hypothetical protein
MDIPLADSSSRPAAYGSFRSEATRERAERLGRRASRKRAIGVSTGALALAAAAFWATMLTLPPTTEAALFSFPEHASCIKAGQSLAPWFEGELHRMKQVGAAHHSDFDLTLTSFREAQSRCASGQMDEALTDLQTLANQIAKLEEHRSWRAD